MPEGGRVDIALCLNIGSSSLKFSLFRVRAQAEECLANGAVEQLGTPRARARLRQGDAEIERACASVDIAGALQIAFQLLAERELPAPTVVGHRVVHGGRDYVRPTRVDAVLLESLSALIPLAPLHLPAAITGLGASLDYFSGVPQVACFDTSFHASLPEYAARFPLPSRLYESGVRRYGFHGLSYEYVLSTLGTPPPERVIVAHLGSGASLAAIEGGRSIDTTMGFTPAGGIMMGTRSGDLDPGLLLYLLRDGGYSVPTLEHLLERESGLLGIAGSADLRTLADGAADERSRLAVVMLGYAVRKAIGAYVAALGGLDVLVFTGGIGEHSPAVREEACRGLGALGIVLDASKNARSERSLHSPASAARILIVETDEDRMIARHAAAMMRAE